MNCLSTPLCIAYIALCMVLLFCGLLAVAIWLLRRRRAAQTGRYPAAWDRYMDLLQAVNGGSPATVQMQRRHSHQSGITLDELDLVAPVRKFGASLEQEDADHPQPSPSSTEVLKPSSRDQAGKANPADKLGSEESVICAICLEDMEINQKTRRLPCLHEYHSGCVEKWTSKANRCPVCSREPLQMELVRSRRNARSSARRRIDAAIMRQRRRHERNTSGRYELSDTHVYNSSPVLDTAEDTPDESFPAQSSAV